MRTTAIILLIILLPATCFANGKVAAIKKGQTAPFDGILLDKKAEATMAAKRVSFDMSDQKENVYNTQQAPKYFT